MVIPQRQAEIDHGMVKTIYIMTQEFLDGKVPEELALDPRGLIRMVNNLSHAALAQTGVESD